MAKHSKDYTSIYDLKHNDLVGNGLDVNLFKQGTAPIKQEITTTVVKKKGKTLSSAMEIITQQMCTSGYRERTVADYTRYFSQ